MRRFVVVGRTARADPGFLLDDVAGTSGRLDVLLRCVRAALLVSHGLRRDTVVDLVLQGTREGEAPAHKAVRVVGEHARFIRPDERSLAILMKKILTWGPNDATSSAFAHVKQGVYFAHAGLDEVLDATPAEALYFLEEGATDVRDVALAKDAIFVVGDHLGLDDDARKILAARGAVPLGLGPTSLHADDAIAVLTNELDRQDAAR